ncbi:MAG: ABC transporter ATP-binding protein [Planctomycetes bacterium]|nr:ABC transporter ATP-binding protein [Planctomycetota bacterium]
MSEHVIETSGLTRYFGARAAVLQVDLQVPRGGVTALAGRNGAGKTTLIRMLLGLLEPTRGSATVLGHDCRHLPPEVRGRVGYLAEGHHVYGWMRVGECGRFQSRFYPQWNEDVFRGVIDYFRLSPKSRAKNLSRGERAGLCLALTLAPEPELLILDDPALGLDPAARRALVEAIVYVTRQAERTILLSSHLLADVERVADRIAVIDNGILRASCSLETFRSRVRRFVLRFSKPPSELPAIPGLLDSTRKDNELALTIANSDQSTEQALAGLGADHVEDVPIGLEDAFISYVGDRGQRNFFMQDCGVSA